MGRVELRGALLFLFGILVFLSSGCYERKEGCLDVEATNFDVEADDACGACCRFAQLKLSFLHRLTEEDTLTVFQLNTPYPHTPDSLDFFSITALRFYISDLRLVNIEGQEFTVSDTLEYKYLSPAGDTLKSSLVDNFAYADRSNVGDIEIGTFRTTGIFTKVKFNLGLENPAAGALPSGFPATHPLFFKNDSTNWSEDAGYVFNWVEFLRDTLPETEPTVIKITEPDLIKIELAHDFEIKKGADINVVLKINYLEWFEGVDWKTDSADEIKRKMLSNIGGVFVLEQVVQE